MRSRAKSACLLPQVAAPASAINYAWDDNGDLTARGSDSFSWDYEDRMVSATVSSVTTTFTYRGDGLRDSKTTGGNTTLTPDARSPQPGNST